MIRNNIDTETQADIQIPGKTDDFFNKFNIAASLHRCGIRKRHGHSVRSLIIAIFTLPFVGKNFFKCYSALGISIPFAFKTFPNATST